MAVRRGIGDVFGQNVGIGELYLLSEGVIGLEHIKQRQRRDATDSIAGSQIEELTFVDFAVSVIIVVVEQFLRKVFGGHTRHRISP